MNMIRSSSVLSAMKIFSFRRWIVISGGVGVGNGGGLLVRWYRWIDQGQEFDTGNG